MKNINVLMVACFFLTIVLHSCSETKPQKDEETIKAMYIESVDLSSKDYAFYKGYIPADGLIPTQEIAVQIAEIILSQLYGQENIEQQKPFSINLEDDVWIIEGYWDRNDFSTDGGVAYMEISKKNGAVLKVIHTK